MKNKVLNAIPKPLLATTALRLFGLSKIPMLFFLRPSVVEMTGKVCTVKIPLKRRSKNHLGSMYFAALAAGADCAGGLAAMESIKLSGEKVHLSFKNFQADFLKRAEGDTYFTCEQGIQIAEFVRQVANSDERMEMPVYIAATCPDKLGDEIVAQFTLTLSLKRK